MPPVLRDQEAADAAGSVGAGDHLAFDLALGLVRVDEPDQRRIPFYASDFDVLDSEADVATVPLACVGEIDEDIRPPVQPARRIHQGAEVDPVSGSVKAQLDAVVLVPVGVHPIADAGIDAALTTPSSRMPARCVVSISCRDRLSMATLSIPLLASR